MMNRTRVVVLLLVTCSSLRAQEGGMAPFTTANDRFMLFDHGRFIEQEPRAPKQVWMNRDRLIYQDHTGALRMLQDGRTVMLEQGSGSTPLCSDHEVAWLSGGALKVAREDGAYVVAPEVGVFTVQDSLVAFHDLQASALQVWWRGRTITVAEVEQGSAAPQWSIGANTLTFYDRSRSRVSLFHRGEVKVLFDSTDIGLVAMGSDIVAYWDDGPGEFRVFDHGRTEDLEPFRPRSFKAADGVVGYVSNGGSFKGYRNGSAFTLLDHTPTEYWVQDSVLLFVDNGFLMTEEGGRAEVVERYVPEQWDVRDASIFYLDLDRGIHRWRHGQRTRIAEGMATKRFERWGNVVLWRGDDGVLRCWWKGKRYEY